MNLLNVLKVVVGELEEASVGYALIGGFAMGLRGVQRATMDLDFILALEDLERADAILQRHGFKRRFRSENVSHYTSDDPDWGRVDLLHAFRKPSLRMLQRADQLEVTPELRLKVAKLEDLIGLKVQALSNDAARAERDWLDIKLLLKSAGSGGVPVDWELLEDYFEIFDLRDRMTNLRKWYNENDAGRT